MIPGSQPAKVEYCFDDQTGFLLRQRTLAGSAGARSGHDVMLRRTASTAGNVTSEAWYGGDGADLATGALCDLTLPANTYRMDHTYQSGGRATSRWTEADGSTGGILSFFSLDQTLDAPSGLVKSSRDVSGLGTAFVYDDFERLAVLRALPASQARRTTVLQLSTVCAA